jgi:hypothetical protein
LFGESFSKAGLVLDPTGLFSGRQHDTDSEVPRDDGRGSLFWGDFFSSGGRFWRGCRTTGGKQQAKEHQYTYKQRNWAK